MRCTFHDAFDEEKERKQKSSIRSSQDMKRSARGGVSFSSKSYVVGLLIDSNNKPLVRTGIL